MVEATSGNTGIGLAMVCAQKGYPLVVTMADSFSVERRKLMRMLGAKVVLTPRAEKGTGMLRKAVELAEANGWFLARQFETQANADIHEATTAREIVNDFAGQRLDAVVTGYGTGGTVTGIGRVLRRERPETRIMLAEPANAALLASGKAQQRTADGMPARRIPPSSRIRSRAGRRTSCPSSCRRRSTGATIDELVPIAGPEAIAMGEGAGAGAKASSPASPGAATVAVACRVAETPARRARPSSPCCPTPGERYCRRRCSRASSRR